MRLQTAPDHMVRAGSGFAQVDDGGNAVRDYWTFVVFADRTRIFVEENTGLHRQRVAANSAATTAGCFVLAFRRVLKILAWQKPAVRNSSRNAPASLAPAIQENQL